MIQVYVLTAWLGRLDPKLTPQSAVTKLKNTTAMVMRLHPALREATMEIEDDKLIVKLRVAGKDRWRTSGAARLIASNMLLRLKIPVTDATIELEYTIPGATSLTKAQGRATSVHARVARVAPEGSQAPRG